MSPEAVTSPISNKRKRGAADEPSARPAPSFKEADGVPPYHVDETAMNQLSAFNNQDPHQNGGSGAAASDTAAAALHYPINADTSFQSGPPGGEYPDTSYSLDQLKESPTQNQGPRSTSVGATPSKPAVGSEEWHKVRKDNHKEVERRRRETINEGINELAKIVPGCEKNKGSILQRAVQYIGQLKEAEGTNLEKWTLEKLLLDQAINELSQTCDRLKADYQKAWTEKEAYKAACEENGLSVDVKSSDEPVVDPTEA